MEYRARHKMQSVRLWTELLFHSVYYVALGSPVAGPGCQEGKMSSPKGEKCAHPVCSCVTTSGKYCSTQCEAVEKTPDIDCSCGHTGCKGKTS